MKKILPTIMIIAALLFSACSSTTQHYTSNKQNTNVDYHKGTEGLVMEFVQDAPPDRIYANSPLDVMIEYSNKGAYDITIGKIYLSGFDENYVNIYPAELPNLQAKGKSIFNPDGRLSDTTTFSASQILIPPSTDRLTQTIKATACYEYMTEASADVCIDPKTTKSLRENICSVHPVSLSGGQGAPIVVTNIEEEVYKNKLQFRIFFQNAGGGTVFRPGLINNCHTSLQREDANKLDLVEVSFSDRTMRCEPQNPINLDDSGRGFVYCYYDGDLGEDAYNTVLDIKLAYGYRNSIQKNFEILREP